MGLILADATRAFSLHTNATAVFVLAVVIRGLSGIRPDPPNRDPKCWRYVWRIGSTRV